MTNELWLLQFFIKFVQVAELWQKLRRKNARDWEEKRSCLRGDDKKRGADKEGLLHVHGLGTVQIG